MFSRLSSRNGTAALAALIGIALALAGCGSSGRGASPGFKSATTAGATTGTTTTLSSGGNPASPSPRALIQNASDEVKKLLGVAKAGTTITPQGTIPNWDPANGSAIPAEPSHISGFGFVADKSKGIEYLSFAVKDTSGKCAGGDLVANAAGTKTTGGKAVSVPDKAPCTGEEVAKLAGHGG
jgi:hypothetical protein